MKPERPGTPDELRRLADAALVSWKGIRRSWRDEPAFRLEVRVLLPACLIAPFIAPSALFAVLMITGALLVIVVELINTAIEAAIDRIGPEHHDLSGKAKDAGSAAVLVSAVMAATIWAIAIWQTVG